MNLKEWAKSHSLTAYQIGQRVGQATGEPSKTVTQRWQRWLAQDSLKTLEIIQQDLSVLGYKLEIKEVKSGLAAERTNE